MIDCTSLLQPHPNDTPTSPTHDETGDSRFRDVCEDAVHVKQDRGKLGCLLRLCSSTGESLAPALLLLLLLLLEIIGRNRHGSHGAEDCCRSTGRHAGWRLLPFCRRNKQLCPLVGPNPTKLLGLPTLVPGSVSRVWSSGTTTHGIDEFATHRKTQRSSTYDVYSY